MFEKILKKTVILTVVVFSLIQSVKAQEGSPLLSSPADIRAAGMGEIVLPNTRNAMLYSSLGAIFLHEETMYISYSLGMNPKSTMDGRQQYHKASVGYRISPKHAIFGGVRLWNSAPIEIEIGSKVGKIISKDRSIDLGYAFNVSEKLSLYTSLSYMNSYNSTTAHIALGNVGVSYNKGSVYLDLSVNNIGPKYHYGKNTENKVKLPTSVRLASSVSLDVFENQELTFGATLNYNFNHQKIRIGDYDSSLGAFTCGLGVEYDIKDVIALRAGGLINKYATVGLGRRFFEKYEVNLAYNIGKYSELNIFSLGFSINM